MGILVRNAVLQDYQAIRRITRDAYLKAGYFDSAEHEYVKVLENVEHRAEHGILWVAELDGAVRGSLVLTLMDQPYADVAGPGELEFRMLAVDPEWQRSGIGRALVEAVIAYARTLDGIDAVVLTSGENMTGAHRLYYRLGFVRVVARDWMVPNTPGEQLRLWVFRLDLGRSAPT